MSGPGDAHHDTAHLVPSEGGEWRTVHTGAETKVIAVVGASGFIGSAAAHALQMRGFHVHKLRAPRLPDIPKRELTEFIQSADAPVRELVRELRGAAAVVNAAGVPDAGSRRASQLIPANAALPGIVARAAMQAKVPRFVHVSSAAVQGNKPVLDATMEVRPFSPYSLSKVLGEYSATTFYNGAVIYRPGGVHGAERKVTALVFRLARSRLALVAAPGTATTPQALIQNVADAVAYLATCSAQPPPIVAHPSEDLTTFGLMATLGGRPPTVIPVQLANLIQRVLTFAERVIPEVRPSLRRVELIMYGQGQAESWLSVSGWVTPVDLRGWKDLTSTLCEIRSN